MSFVKFFSLVKSQSLYFPSAFQLLSEDPFEGSLTHHEAKYQRVVDIGEGGAQTPYIVDKETIPLEFSDEFGKIQWPRIIRIQREMRKLMRRFVFMNCWHLNDVESLAMWKLYGLSGDGIAIVSNYKRLRESILYEKSFHIGMVKYIDYAKEESFQPNLLEPFICKSLSFRHENELRIVINAHRKLFEDAIQNLYDNKETIDWPDNGFSISCDLINLIDYIVVSPTSPRWVFDLVSGIANEHEREVRFSDLLNSPFF